jgi:hypothetical protein
VARTTLAVQNFTGCYPIIPSLLTFTPGDATNGNSVAISGRYIVYATNTGGTNQTFSILTTPDGSGRLDDKEITVEPGTITRIDGISSTGFRQSDGCFYIDVSSDDIELAVWRLDR